MKYKFDYWGFVYLWRDARSGMYCVGSHYGSVNDGYISSTGNLKQAFRKRRSDFKRRIIYWLRSDDRELLLLHENRFLSLIKDHELSTVQNHNSDTVRYYNCKKFAMGGAWNKGLTGVQIYRVKRCEYCGRSFKIGMYSAWHGERCLHNPQLSDEHRAARQRKKTVRQPSYVSDNINKLPFLQCSVCGVTTSRGNIARWHEENCRPRRNRPDVLCRAAALAGVAEV